MPTVASMKAILSLSSAAFERGMSKARRTSRRFGRSITNVSRMVQRFGGRLSAIAGIGGVAGVGFLVRQEMKLLDAVAKTSDKLGIQSENLIGLQFAGRLAGVQVRQVDMALQRMTRRIAEAAMNTGEAQEVLKTLGVTAKDFVKLPMIEQVTGLADAFNASATAGEQVRRGFKLFDSEGVAFINVLRLGRKGIEDLVKEAKLLGFAFSRGELRKIEDANDALTRTGLILRGLIGKVSVAIAPILQAASTAFGNWISRLTSGDFTGRVQRFFVTVANWVGKVLDWIRIDIPLALVNLGETALRALQPFAFGEAGKALENYVKTLQLLRGELQTKVLFGDLVTPGGPGHKDIVARGLFRRYLEDQLFKFAGAAGGRRKTIFTDIIESMSAAAGMAPRAQLAAAGELGIVGGQARFSRGFGRTVETTAKTISKRVESIDDRLWKIHQAIKEQSTGLTVGQ